jgi:hypothetical protein
MGRTQPMGIRGKYQLSSAPRRGSMVSLCEDHAQLSSPTWSGFFLLPRAMEHYFRRCECFR